MWKGRFLALATVFHATNCFLSPDSQDILGVREMLLEGANEGATATAAASMAASPTDGSEGVPTKKRSPCSPRYVIIGGGVASRMLSPRGNGSLFRQGSSSGSLSRGSSRRTIRGPQRRIGIVERRWRGELRHGILSEPVAIRGGRRRGRGHGGASLVVL